MPSGLSNIARVGALVGDPVRAAMLAEMMDGGEHAAGDLAQRAGASPQAASAHLKLLLDGGLLSVRARGRYRYYRLRDADVAHAIESLSFAASLARRKTERLDPGLKHARRCYDHIAGTLGVAICDSVILKGIVIAGPDGFAISAIGYQWLVELELEPPRVMSRALVRPCLDWTEGRPHIAGWLGSALCERLESVRALKRHSKNRSLALTPTGRLLFGEYFGLEWRSGDGSERPALR
jgi:DNA-binding transcriptional ArsR family regulator